MESAIIQIHIKPKDGNDMQLQQRQHMPRNSSMSYLPSICERLRQYLLLASITLLINTVCRSDICIEQTSLQEHRKAILDSLRFEQIDSRHSNIKVVYSKTCEWLLRHPDYIHWLDPDKFNNHHGFLWINGKPGSGKSSLMKFAFTDAKRRTGINAATVSFFFNARGDTLEKTTTGMLRSILLQVLEKFPDLQDVLDGTRLVPQNQNGSAMWKVDVLQRLFSTAVSRLNKRRVICFIDALDECSENEVRAMVEFFETLGDEASQIENRLCICLSSRHYPYIHIRHGKQLVLEDQPDHGKDLERYVQGRLKLGKPALIREITNQMLHKAAGVFMWAVLVVDILNKEFEKGRIFAVKARLQQIPDQLSELFKDMLRRDNDNMAELLLCIQWILYAERPLKREEFYFAVVSGISPAELAEWDPEYISTDDMGRFVLSSSKGLAEVTRSKNKTVQFIHESVRDFLVKDNGLRDLWHELGEDIASLSHDRLKQCCLAYIGIDKSGYLPSSSSSTSMTLPKASSNEAKTLRESVSAKFPFLEYAVHQVFYHANEAAAGLQQSTFLRLFPLKSWIDLDNLFEKYQIRRHTPSATFLYLFAEKNWTRLVATQLDCDPQTNLHGERYRYPLFAAIASGHRNAAEVILQHCMNSESDIPLQILRGQSPGVPKDWTLLSWAAHKTDEGIVKLLLDTGMIDVNIKDTNGETALSWAAEYEHEGLVRLLLNTSKVDINVKNDLNETPLSKAATKGHERIVRLLLNTGKVDVNIKKHYGGTALSRAVTNGHEGTVGLLLDTGKVDIDLKYESGRILLLEAMQEGDEGIMKLLLNAGGVDVDAKGGDGQTLLCWAAENGYKKIAQLLLDTNRVDPNAKDKDGRTPLLLAVQPAQSPPTEERPQPLEPLIESVGDLENDWIKFWLSREQRRKEEETRIQRDEIVQLLLETDRVDLDAKDKNGRTPLSWAAQIGHEKIVQLLLDTEKVNPDAQDEDGQTPLSWAAQNGHETTVELLRKRL